MNSSAERTVRSIIDKEYLPSQEQPSHDGSHDVVLKTAKELRHPVEERAIRTSLPNAFADFVNYEPGSFSQTSELVPLVGLDILDDIHYLFVPYSN